MDLESVKPKLAALLGAGLAAGCAPLLHPMAPIAHPIPPSAARRACPEASGTCIVAVSVGGPAGACAVSMSAYDAVLDFAPGQAGSILWRLDPVSVGAGFRIEVRITEGDPDGSQLPAASHGPQVAFRIDNLHGRPQDFKYEVLSGGCRPLDPWISNR